MLLSIGTVASVRMVRLVTSSSTMRSSSWKYSRRIRDSRAFRSDQLIDARAEILHDEVLLGGCLAVVHFLSPLLERKLNAKGLVDGKGNVEEVEAVDSQI